MTDTTLTETTTTPPTETTEAPPQVQQQKTNVGQFLTEKGIPNITPFKTMTILNNRFKRVMKDINNELNLVYIDRKVTTDNKVLLDGFTRLVRAKLKQGKQWSRELVDAVVADYYIAYTNYLVKEAAKKAEEAKDNASTINTSTGNINVDGTTESTTETHNHSMDTHISP